MGISFAWVLILGVGIIFFPESPRYDYRHGRIEEAKKTMTRLYGVSNNHRVVADELEEIKQKHEEELLHQNQKWWEMFRGPRMAYRIALGVSLQALQQLTGANYFFYYGTVIFKSTGMLRSQYTPNPEPASSILQILTLNFRYQQFFRHTDNSWWRQFRHDLHRSLRRRALRTSEVTHLWRLLDVCVLHGFRVCWSLQLEPR